MDRSLQELSERPINASIKSIKSLCPKTLFSQYYKIVSRPFLIFIKPLIKSDFSFPPSAYTTKLVYRGKQIISVLSYPLVVLMIFGEPAFDRSRPR